MIPEIEIDAAIQLSDLNQSFYNILQQMEPFGPDNTKPIFCVKNAQNIGCRVVKEEHVRFEIAQDGHIMNGIGFNLAKKYEALNRPNHLDVVFVLDENHFNGKTTLQMKVLDFRVSEK